MANQIDLEITWISCMKKYAVFVTLLNLKTLLDKP